MGQLSLVLELANATLCNTSLGWFHLSHVGRGRRINTFDLGQIPPSLRIVQLSFVFRLPRSRFGSLYFPSPLAVRSAAAFLRSSCGQYSVPRQRILLLLQYRVLCLVACCAVLYCTVLCVLETWSCLPTCGLIGIEDEVDIESRCFLSGTAAAGWLCHFCIGGGTWQS